jgi:hypothetical protein
MEGNNMREDFLFTVPSGEPVQLEPFHYAIVGQTQFSGKSTLLKRLSEWAVNQGFKVLIPDTKETEADYAGFGREVPVCLRETTDSFVLIGLLESLFKRRLTPYYATLSRITEGAKGFDDIINRAKEREAKTKSSWLKDACRVLYDLLERLKAETSRVKTVPTLTLRDGINRMVINEFSLEAQQLIVKNAFEDALRKYKRNLIMVLDEAFKFLPQGYSSPATRAVMQVITQGAKTGLYTWISTQFLAVTDKDPLKACAIKFLGTQDHITEVKHTLDLIPEARGRFSADDIMKLKLGHWILVRKRPPDVRVVYALPVGVPAEVGGKVAVGELTPEHVRDRYIVPKLEEDEMVWKEKYEQLRSMFDKQVEDERQKAYREALRKVDEIKKQWNVEEYQQTIMQLKDEAARLREDLKSVDILKAKKDEEIAELRKELEDFRELKNALAKVFPVPMVQIPEGQTAPSHISVATEQPSISVKVERRPLNLTDKDLHGKIAVIYSEGALGESWFSVSDVVRAFQRHAWKRDPRISTALDEFANWGYLEKKYAGRKPIYRVRLKPEEAKAKGLLKVEE